MPSASTNNPMSASVPIMSSLCSRTLPVSVSATLAIFPFKLMGFVQSWQSTRYARSTVVQSGRHLGAGVVACFGTLGERAIDDAFDAGGQIRPKRPQRRVRRFGDLLHQSGHRIGGEWKLSGQQLK